MASKSGDSRGLRNTVLQRLESLERAGVASVRKSKRPEPKRLEPEQPESPAPVAQAARSGTMPSPESAAAAAREAAVKELAAATRAAASAPAISAPATLFQPPRESAPLSRADRVAALDAVRQEVAACTRCKQLCTTRTQTVFGVGNPMTRLCFVGEAPGADEDRQGEPFVGRAGQLLTKIIEACRLKRDEVYILNVLKCRPPDNRTPLPDEISNCRGFLERQLEIIRPEFICCLGTVAAQAVLQTDTTIGRLRGRFHDYRGTPVLCTYHPSYLLRNPAAKRDVWDDMKTLLRRMGVELDG